MTLFFYRNSTNTYIFEKIKADFGVSAQLGGKDSELREISGR